MTEISRSALFGRLNPTALKAIETATGFCKMRGNPYVELVHWIHILLQDAQNDLSAIRTAFGIDDTQLARDVVSTLDGLPRGASSISDFSPQIEEAIEKGWLYASLQFSASRVRTGHLLYGMLRTPTLKNALGSISAEWRKVQVEKLGEEFEKICASSTEQTQVDAGPATGATDTGGGPVAEGEALIKFSVDLTEQARTGKIDKIVGRDAEIRQVIDILLRRRQNNPILVGEAGVGKTAVVEGFAKRIVDGDVPPALQGVTLRALDIGLMQAGASVKGEFEKRLRQVIDEVESSPKPIILFIDEAHTLIGAGGQAGTGDAANLLKPALARGRLRTVAATTYAEYRQYFEKDPALTRRFQTVDVGEPETDKAIAMIRSAAPMMEGHHNVVVLDEAVEASVKLSQRYVPARQLPDKAVSLLDTACARVAVSQHATPAQVEDRARKLELLEVEREIAAREASGQFANGDRLPKLDEAIAQAKAALDDITVKWDAEKAALENVVLARDALRAARDAAGEGNAVEDDEPLKAALQSAIAAMNEAAGDNPMVFGVCDADAVAAVVGDWTGIPMGRMVKNEIESVLTISDQLKARVIGQDHAMDAIAKRIQTSRAKLDNPNKPVGVFMLCGPSGVGKTETAMVLSELLFSGDDSLIVINMSEFQEAHTVSTLKGAPAGYVGYGQGGVLTEAVRRHPYSVVLLDEVEKAHPDVHEMFFQVFDKGFMNDAEGRYIDFKNTLILLTSNVGTDLITTLSEDEEMKPDPEALATSLRPDLLKVFPPALLGRLLVLPYYPLSPGMLKGIVRIQLDRIVKRVADSHDIAFTYGDDVIDLIVSRCNEVASGGRLIDAILTNTMLPELSIELLNRQMGGEEVKEIAVRVEGDGFGYSFG
jgi:type VI secretion system protein VasG